MRRTAEAIAAMVAEAREHGVEAIAAVGTAGLRIAPNSAELIDAVRARDRRGDRGDLGRGGGRLAYLAVRAGLGLSRRLARRVRHRRRQLPVHVRPRRRGRRAVQRGRRRGPVHGAVRPRPCGVRGRARRGDGGDRRRPRPSRRAARRRTGWSGWAAPSPTSRPSSTSSRRTTRRSSRARCSTPQRSTGRSSSTARGAPTSAARSSGLQPNRAEVILAGACIVRTVMSKLGSESLTVSDRGLRHGVLVERFGGRS